MTAYHHSYPHYTGHVMTRRPSQSTALHSHIEHDGHAHGYFEHDSLYHQPNGRVDTRHDPTAYRNHTLPTPIHDPEPENSQGRRRVTLACARCRKRKIKCSGDPGNGMGCQACRSSGVLVIHCVFDRVGTTHKYCIEPNSADSPTSPTSSYGSMGYAGLPVDGASRSLSYSQLDAYGFELQNLPDPQSLDERVWTTHRPSQNGYTNLTPVTSYDSLYHAPMPRIITNSETLAPISTAALQSGPPLAVNRRLPAPKLVDTPLSAELASPTASVSGRFASMSLGGSQPRNSIENNTLPSTGRQKSIQDLANASVMLPPVSRDYKAIAPAPLDQPYLFSNAGTEDLFAACTAAAGPSPYATSLPPMPPMPPYSSLSSSRYTASLPTSTPSISTIMTSDCPVSRHSQASRPLDHGWTTTNGPAQRRASATNVSDDDEGGQSQRYQPIAIAPIISSSTCSQPQLTRTSSSHSTRREKSKNRVGSVQYGPSGKL